MSVSQKKILLRCSDDSVIIMSFILDDGHFIHREGTPAEIADEIARASVAYPPDRLPILGWKELPDVDIPRDRSFRDAWKTGWDMQSIGHDMPKAREIHRERMRRARAPKLLDLDTEYLRADEAGDQQRKREIVQQKQSLRDVTALPAIDTAQTTDELKAIWPVELGNSPYSGA